MLKNIFYGFVILSLTLNAEIFTLTADKNHTFYKTLNEIKSTNGNYSSILYNNIDMPDSSYDIFLSFDEGIKDKTGNYKVKASDDIKSVNGVNGSKAMFLPHITSNVEVFINETGFLKGEGIGSFTIGFYLNPYKQLVNSTVMARMGVHSENGEKKLSGIKAFILNGRLVWEFADFFKYGNTYKNIVLDRGTFLKAGEWSYHSISYDASTGKLVKYLNGFEEEIVYVTTTGLREGSVYRPYFAANNTSSLLLGRGFVGAIDSFNIILDYKRNYNLAKYCPSGEFVSKVIDLKNENAHIQALNLNSQAENGTAVYLYYRASDKYFLPDNNTIAWIKTETNGDIGYKKARYIQVKSVLYSEATHNYTPVLNSIDIVYDIPKKPLKPINLTARAINSAVILSWDEEYSGNASGYKIYYSRKPGIYNEFENVPIIIDKRSQYTVEGLDSGALYYFKVSAYDYLGEWNESDHSDEVYARPN